MEFHFVYLHPPIPICVSSYLSLRPSETNYTYIYNIRLLKSTTQLRRKFSVMFLSSFILIPLLCANVMCSPAHSEMIHDTSITQEEWSPGIPATPRSLKIDFSRIFDHRKTNET